MDFDDFFKARIDALHAEGRYRVFADLERRCGSFPRAYDHRIGAEVTVDWGGPGAGGIAGEPTWRIRATIAEQPFLRQHRRDDNSRPTAAGVG